MSTQVLLALVDAKLLMSLDQDEIDDVTAALVAEIKSDPALKQRLTNAVNDSAAQILAQKTVSTTTAG